MIVPSNGYTAFLKGNSLYQEKKYREALQSYNLINKKGRATWYNMGSCYFSLKKYPRAIACWRKAQKNASYKELSRIEKNITQAYEKLDHKISGPIISFTEKMVSGISLGTLQMMFLLFWFTFFISLYWLKRKRKLVCVVLLFINCFLFLFVLSKYSVTMKQKGIVLESVDIFVGPDTHYYKLGTLQPADEFEVLKTQKKWYKIKRAQKIGWALAADNIEII